jgi:hypothetical protein
MLSPARDNWIPYLLALVCLLVGFAVGLAFNDIPHFSWSREISVSSLAQLLLAILVAFWIPFTLSPLVTNKRAVKDFIIDETKDCIEFVHAIKAEVDKLAIQGKTSAAERTKLNMLMSRDLGMKIASLADQLSMSFESKSRLLRKEIGETHIEYWDRSTSGNLMKKSYNVDLAYVGEHNRNYAKMQAVLKKAVHSVNSF